MKRARSLESSEPILGVVMKVYAWEVLLMTTSIATRVQRLSLQILGGTAYVKLFPQVWPLKTMSCGRATSWPVPRAEAPRRRYESVHFLRGESPALELLAAIHRVPSEGFLQAFPGFARGSKLARHVHTWV